MDNVQPVSSTQKTKSKKIRPKSLPVISIKAVKEEEEEEEENNGEQRLKAGGTDNKELGLKVGGTDNKELGHKNMELLEANDNVGNGLPTNGVGRRRKVWAPGLTPKNMSRRTSCNGEELSRLSECADDEDGSIDYPLPGRPSHQKACHELPRVKKTSQNRMVFRRPSMTAEELTNSLHSEKIENLKLKIDKFIPPEIDQAEEIKIPNELPVSRRGSRIWSRRPSCCGGEQLRMDDEMATVIRDGVEMEIPTLISYWVAPVPIRETDQHIRQTYVDFGDIEDDEYSLYKTVKVDLHICELKDQSENPVDVLVATDLAVEMYEMFKDIDLSPEEKLQILKNKVGLKDKKKIEEMWKNGCTIEEIIEYISKHGETKEEEHKKVAENLEKLFSNKDMSEEEMLKLAKEVLGEDMEKAMKDMLDKGYTMEQVVDHFKKNPLVEETETEVEKQMKAMFDGKDLNPEKKLALLKAQLGPKSQQLLEQMLKEGKTIDEVIEHFMKHGRTAQQEKADSARKINKLKDSKSICERDLLKTIKDEMGSEAEQVIKDMLASGYSLDEALKYVNEHGTETEFEKQMKELTGGKNLTSDEMLDLLKSQLGPESQAKLEAMLKEGKPIGEVLQHFMKYGKSEEQEKQDICRKLNKVLEGGGSQEQVVESIRKQFGEDGEQLIKDMLASGHTLEEALEYIKTHGTETEFERKMKELTGGKNLSSDEKLDFLKNQLGSESKAKMEEMLKEGKSLEEVMAHFMKHGKTEEEEKEDKARKLQKVLAEGGNEVEILEGIKKEFGEDGEQLIKDMLASGHTMEEALAYIKDHGTETEFERKMKELTGGKDLSSEDKLEILKGQLGPESLAKMEEMLKEGKSMEEVAAYFMKHGKTEDEEIKDTARKFAKATEGKSMNEEELLKYIQEQYGVGSDMETLVKDMLGNKYSVPEILEYIKTHGSETEFQRKIKAMSGGKHLSTEDTMAFLKSQLGPESLAKMEEMLKSGIPIEEVMEHFMKHGKSEEEEKKDTCRKVKQLLDGNSKLSEDELLKAIKDEFGDDMEHIMKDMLSSGHTMEEVLQYIKEHGSETEVERRMKRLSTGRALTPDQMLELIKSELGPDSLKLMEEMLSSGVSVEEVLKHFMKSGKTKEQEREELCRKIDKIENMKLDEEEKLKMLKELLGPQGEQMIEELTLQGLSLDEIIELYKKHGKDIDSIFGDEQFTETISFGEKGDTNAKLNTFLNTLDPKSQEKLRNMLQQGISADRAMELLANKAGQVNLCKKLSKLLANNASKNEIMKSLKEEFGSDMERAVMNILNDGYTMEELIERIQELLKEGYTKEEVRKYLADHGIDGGKETEIEKRLKDLTKGKKISSQAKLELLKNQLGSESKQKMEEMLKAGKTVEEVLEFLMRHGKTEEQEKAMICNRMQNILSGKNNSEGEVLSLIKKEFGIKMEHIVKELLNMGYTLKEIIDKIQDMFKKGHSIDDIIKHLLNNGLEDEQESEIGKRMRMLSGGKKLSPERMMDLLKSQLGPDSKQKMEEMIREGRSKEDICAYFLDHGKTVEEEQAEICRRFNKLLMFDSMTQDDALTLVKEQFGSSMEDTMKDLMKQGCNMNDVMKKIEDMLQQGFSLDEIMDHLNNNGLEEEKETEVQRRMSLLTHGKNLSQKEKLDLLKCQLGPGSLEKMNEMLRQGRSIEDVMEYFLKHGATEEQEQATACRRIKKLLSTRSMSEEEILDLIKEDFSEDLEETIKVMLHKGHTLEEVMKSIEAMLKDGYSLDEIVDELMKNGIKTDKETLIEKRMKHLTKGLNLSLKEKLDLLRIQLGPKSKTKMEDMLQEGKSLEEVFNYFMKHGKTEGEEQAEMCRRLKKFLSSNSMNEDEALSFVKEEFGDNIEAAMRDMLNKGYTIDEVIEKTEELLKKGWTMAAIAKHFIENMGTREEEQKKMVDELSQLLNRKDLTKEEMLLLVKEQFGYKAEAALNEMLQRGQSIEDIIDNFVKDGFDERKETELEKKMKSLLKGKKLSPEENLELLKSQLGPESKEKMEEMLKQGKSADYIWRYFMKHGETLEQEQSDVGVRLKKILARNSLTQEEIIKLVRKEFGYEMESAIRELFSRGYTVKEVIDYLTKLLSITNMNKKEMLKRVNEKIVIKSRSGSAQSGADAHVFTIIDISEAKDAIPFIHPGGKFNIFRTFFKKLHKFVSGKGLSEYDLLDLIRSRLGGTYATEFDLLRAKGSSLQEIVEYFLKKDEGMREEAKRRAHLVGKAKIDKRIELYRSNLKQRWGIIMHYTYSRDCGLHLILDSVSPEGPAYACGARSGDIIKTIYAWKTYLMDQPAVAAHLFQAGGEKVNLGIQNPPIEDEDLGVVGIY